MQPEAPPNDARHHQGEQDDACESVEGTPPPVPAPRRCIGVHGFQSSPSEPSSSAAALRRSSTALAARLAVENHLFNDHDQGRDPNQCSRIRSRNSTVRGIPEAAPITESMPHRAHNAVTPGGRVDF
jgi:hypothetical protein